MLDQIAIRKRSARASTSAFRTHWRWPLAAALLPSSLRFRLLSWVARNDRAVFQEEVAAYAEAKRHGFAQLPEDAPGTTTEAGWRRAWRLVQLVDHDDLFRALRGRRSTLADSINVDGAWPARGAFLAITYHWGAGLHALAQLAQGGRRGRFLSARSDRASLGDDVWRWRYARLRTRMVEKLAGGPIIYTGGASEQIRAALKQGDCVIGLCDAIIDPGRSRVSVAFGLFSLAIPLGLLRLAVESRVPVVPFASGIDRSSGRRQLVIGEARVYTDETTLATALVSHLYELVERDPAAWHMWPHARRLLTECDGA